MLGQEIVMVAQLFTAWIRRARTLAGGKGLRAAKINTKLSAIIRQTRFSFLAFIFQSGCCGGRPAKAKDLWV